jgi:hypothetical protein
MLNKKLIVCWPVNNECGISFHDLFDTEVEEIKVAQLNPPNDYFQFGEIMPHIQDYPQFKGTPVLLDATTETEQFVRTLKDIDIYFSSWRHIDSLYSFDEFFKHFQFKKEFIDKANIFRDVTTTVHVRCTDVPTTSIESKDYIRKLGTKIFVCSDELRWEVEACSYYPDSVSRRDKVYPEKRDNTLPYLVRRYEFNVQRSKEVVIDAVIDMLIMSRTRYIFGNIYSTLAHFAHLLFRYSNPGVYALYDYEGKFA